MRRYLYPGFFLIVALFFLGRALLGLGPSIPTYLITGIVALVLAIGELVYGKDPPKEKRRKGSPRSPKA